MFSSTSESSKSNQVGANGLLLKGALIKEGRLYNNFRIKGGAYWRGALIVGRALITVNTVTINAMCPIIGLLIVLHTYSKHPLIRTPTGPKNLFEIANVRIIDGF